MIQDSICVDEALQQVQKTKTPKNKMKNRWVYYILKQIVPFWFRLKQI